VEVKAKTLDNKQVQRERFATRLHGVTPHNTLLYNTSLLSLLTPVYPDEYVFVFTDAWPPLWSSGQSSYLQIQCSGFYSRRYQIF
jgi:hypothetical protein